MNKDTQDISLLVLAAGMGSRYGGLKQLDTFGPHGESIIDYSVYDAIRAGFDEIVFVVRESFIDAFKDFYVPKFGHRITLKFLTQETHKLPAAYENKFDRQKPWGTAHAVLMGAEVIDGSFGVINADDFYGRDSFFKLAEFLRMDSSDDYCMIAYYLENTLSEHGTVNRGVCASDVNGNLTEVAETLKIGYGPDQRVFYPNPAGQPVEINKSSLVSMNMWGFRPSYFQYAEQYFKNFLDEYQDGSGSEFFIPLVVDHLIKNKVLNCKVINTNASWFGVTYPEDKAFVVDKLNDLIDAGEYPASLWK
jgi:NDP-sugar pyrophosphorylase family protein